MDRLSFLTKIYKYRKLPTSFHLLEQKTQTISSLVFTLLALSFFGIFAISPTVSTIAQLQKQLSDNKKVNTELQQKIDNISKLTVQYKTIQNDIPLVLQVLPQTPNVPAFLAQLQDLSRSANVTLSNLQAAQVDLTTATQNNSSSFTFSFSATGAYNDISRFISGLINFNRLVSIDAISINQSSDGKTQLSLRGKAYFKK